MNKRRSTYFELSARETRTLRSMLSGRWLRPSRSLWAGLIARLPKSSPAVSSPAGAALSPSSPAVFTRAGAALPDPAMAPGRAAHLVQPAQAVQAEPALQPTQAEPAAQPAEPEHDRSMLAVVVIALAVTVLALSVLVGTEVVLRALGRTSFISEFVGSPSANPGYIYDLILIAIAVLGASLGTAFLLVSAIVGVRLERRQGIVLETDAAAGSDAANSGAAFGAAAAGALSSAVVSRFAPPASAGAPTLFTPPDALETAVR